MFRLNSNIYVAEIRGSQYLFRVAAIGDEGFVEVPTEGDSPIEETPIVQEPQPMGLDVEGGEAVNKSWPDYVVEAAKFIATNPGLFTQPEGASKAFAQNIIDQVEKVREEYEYAKENVQSLEFHFQSLYQNIEDFYNSYMVDEPSVVG
jgi:hypothetical protein